MCGTSVDTAQQSRVAFKRMFAAATRAPRSRKPNRHSRSRGAGNNVDPVKFSKDQRVVCWKCDARTRRPAVSPFGPGDVRGQRGRLLEGWFNFCFYAPDAGNFSLNVIQPLQSPLGPKEVTLPVLVDGDEADELVKNFWAELHVRPEALCEEHVCAE